MYLSYLEPFLPLLYFSALSAIASLCFISSFLPRTDLSVIVIMYLPSFLVAPSTYSIFTPFTSLPFLSTTLYSPWYEPADTSFTIVSAAISSSVRDMFCGLLKEPAMLLSRFDLALIFDAMKLYMSMAGVPQRFFE